MDYDDLAGLGQNRIYNVASESNCGSKFALKDSPMSAIIEVKIISGAHTGEVYGLPEDIFNPFFAGTDSVASPAIEKIKFDRDTDSLVALFGSIESPFTDVGIRHDEYLGLAALDNHEDEI